MFAVAVGVGLVTGCLASLIARDRGALFVYVLTAFLGAFIGSYLSGLIEAAPMIPPPPPIVSVSTSAEPAPKTMPLQKKKGRAFGNRQ